MQPSYHLPDLQRAPSSRKSLAQQQPHHGPDDSLSRILRAQRPVRASSQVNTPNRMTLPCVPVQRSFCQLLRDAKSVLLIFIQFLDNFQDMVSALSRFLFHPLFCVCNTSELSIVFFFSPFSVYRVMFLVTLSLAIILHSFNALFSVLLVLYHIKQNVCTPFLPKMNSHLWDAWCPSGRDIDWRLMQNW